MVADEAPAGTAVSVNPFEVFRDVSHAVGPSPKALIRGFASDRSSEYLDPLQGLSLPGRWAVVSYRGRVPYMAQLGAIKVDPDPVHISVGVEVTLDAAGVLAMTEAPPGLHVFLITPLRGDDEESYPYARNVLTAAQGWLTATCGRHLVERQLFENILDLDTLAPSASVEVSVYASACAEPLLDYDEAHFDALGDLTDAADGLDARQQAAVELSLRWYARSLKESALDAYLATFFALEALASSVGDGQKVMQATYDLLAGAYAMQRQEVINHFGVGRFQGLRDRIAHGATDSVELWQLRYLEAVYLDVLHYRLGRPAAGVAERMRPEIGWLES